jgi:hypothetical protein
MTNHETGHMSPPRMVNGFTQRSVLVGISFQTGQSRKVGKPNASAGGSDAPRCLRVRR